MSEGSVELAYSSIRVFSDDGTLDMGELNFLLGIALKDGEIDDDEKRVLNKIFEQADDDLLSPTVKARIAEVKGKYSL